MPGAAWPAPGSLDAMREARPELVAPASDRFMADRDASLEQRFFDVAQAELEAEIPADGLADDDCREPMSTIVEALKNC